jgi:anthranilate synthase component I
MKLCPNKEELKTLIKENLGNLIPVYTVLKADLLTPVSAYLKISEGKKYSFLFESVEGGSRIGRYSFLGAGDVEVMETGQGYSYGKVDPLSVLEEKLSAYKYVSIEQLPHFTGKEIFDVETVLIF